LDRPASGEAFFLNDHHGDQVHGAAKAAEKIGQLITLFVHYFAQYCAHGIPDYQCKCQTLALSPGRDSDALPLLLIPCPRSSVYSCPHEKYAVIMIFGMKIT
jgi:hypothetical protein